MKFKLICLIIATFSVSLVANSKLDSLSTKYYLGNQILNDEIKISGTVTDAVDGLPVIGVSVMIKGTNRGTITDVDGTYSINVPDENSILVFSYIGYKKQEITVGSQSVIDVNLAIDAVGLDEVVVVGYGTQKKSDITGSVASFDTKTLQERPQTNVVQALQGNVAGLTVNTSNASAEDGGAILVRGQNSISASNSPLIVLDGIPYEGSLSQISPNDIQSLEVLKDASSTAIYGSRGANGVILVTTKKGKPGKIKISYNGFTSFDQISNLPDMQNASEHWGSNWERVVTNRMGNPSNTASLSELIDGSFPGTETSNADLEAFMQGYPNQTWDDIKNSIVAKYPDVFSDRAMLLQLAGDFAYPEGGRNTDWLSLATRTGIKQEHNVSISGGTEDVKYFLSANQNNSEGIAIGDKFGRTIFRANVSAQLLPGVTYGTNTQFGLFDRSGVPASWSGGSGAFRINPLYNAYNDDGTLDLTPNDDDISVRNPLEPLLFKNEDKQKQINTNHFLDINIPGIQGLNYRLNTGFRFSDRTQKTYKGLNTVEGGIRNGDLNIVNAGGNSYTIENILSYKKDFGKHSIFLTGLYSAQKSVDEVFRLSANQFPNDVRTFYQADNAEILTSTSGYTQKSYLSQMLRANYTFGGRFLFTGTVRRDGFSAFGENSKYGIFPSVALGWNISNENFMQSLDMIETLKLRLSYGENGNEAVRPYSKLANLQSTNYIGEAGNILYGYRPNRLANPELSWETTKSYNIGLDFAFKNGRVQGAIDAFSSNTFDLLLFESISSVNGTNSILRNVGETQNVGFEIQVSTVNISTRDFSWRTNFTGSLFRSEIVQVGLRDDDGNFIDDVASEWFIGHPVNVNFGFSLDRILQKEDFLLDPNGNYLLDENDNYQLRPEIADQIVDKSNSGVPRPGQPIAKDVNGDGLIDPNDREIQGNQNPDFTAGLTNTLTYKNFSFSFFLNGVWGVTKLNKFINNNGFATARKMDIEYWTPENPTTGLPGLNFNSLTSGIDLNTYQDASYVRIQDVTLSYRFPKVMLERIRFDNLEVFGNLKNVYTFTNWEGLDPDYDPNASEIPRPFGSTIGLRLTF